jgi:hypothetical protein
LIQSKLPKLSSNTLGTLISLARLHQKILPKKKKKFLEKLLKKLLLMNADSSMAEEEAEAEEEASKVLSEDMEVMANIL